MQSLSGQIKSLQPVVTNMEPQAAYSLACQDAAALAEQWEREQAEHIVVWTEQIDTLQRRLSELLTELAEAKQAHAQT